MCVFLTVAAAIPPTGVTKVRPLFSAPKSFFSRSNRCQELFFRDSLISARSSTSQGVGRLPDSQSSLRNSLNPHLERVGRDFGPAPQRFRSHYFLLGHTLVRLLSTTRETSGFPARNLPAVPVCGEVGPPRRQTNSDKWPDRSSSR